MKRFLFLFFSVFLIFSLILPAYAAEAGEGESGSEDTVTFVPDVNVFNTVNIPEEDLGTYVGSSVYSLTPYSGDPSSLKSVLLAFLGDWETVVVEHSYQAADGSINTVHEAQPDYAWLCSAAILAIFIFCLFRLGGSILCKT